MAVNAPESALGLTVIAAAVDGAGRGLTPCEKVFEYGHESFAETGESVGIVAAPHTGRATDKT